MQLDTRHTVSPCAKRRHTIVLLEADWLVIHDLLREVNN
jgi:hypothetical protein